MFGIIVIYIHRMILNNHNISHQLVNYVIEIIIVFTKVILQHFDKYQWFRNVGTYLFNLFEFLARGVGRNTKIKS